MLTLKLSWFCLVSYLSLGLVWSVQTSSDLRTWTDYGICKDEVQISTNGAMALLTVDLGQPTNVCAFFRVGVYGPP